jgi:hypothetical protein
MNLLCFYFEDCLLLILSHVYVKLNDYFIFLFKDILLLLTYLKKNILCLNFKCKQSSPRFKLEEFELLFLAVKQDREKNKFNKSIKYLMCVFKSSSRLLT